MKKIFIVALASLFFLSCHMVHPLQPTQEEAMHLISAIPDHQIFPGTKEMFTRQYYSALSNAWAVPSNSVDGIGDDEWLYYFITGNGDCDDFRIENISILSHKRQATLHFSAFCCGEPQDHSIKLHYEHGSWRIADYDNTLSQLVDYKTAMIKYFKSDEWQEYLNEFLSDPEWKTEGLKKKTEVDEYLSKHH